MKTLIAFSLLVATTAHAELNSHDLKECALMGGEKAALFALAGKDSGVRYKFDGNDVFKITIPQGANNFSIPLKSAKGVCFSRQGSDPAETSSCPKSAAVEKLSGFKLNEAFEAIMDQYSAQLPELISDARKNGKDNPEAGDARAYVEMFKPCRKIGPISKDFAQPRFDKAAQLIDQLDALTAPKQRGTSGARSSNKVNAVR